MDSGNTPWGGQKVPEFDCLNFHDILYHHKKTCSPKNVIWVAMDPKSCEENMLYSFYSLYFVTKNKQYNECKLCRKKFLAIIFFSTAKHFIIKRNNFSNNPFLSAK